MIVKHFCHYIRAFQNQPRRTRMIIGTGFLTMISAISLAAEFSDGNSHPFHNGINQVLICFLCLACLVTFECITTHGNPGRKSNAGVNQTRDRSRLRAAQEQEPLTAEDRAAATLIRKLVGTDTLDGKTEQEISAIISNARRSVARHLHPDVGPHERIAERTRALAKANNALDAISQVAGDRRLASGGGMRQSG